MKPNQESPSPRSQSGDWRSQAATSLKRKRKTHMPSLALQACKFANDRRTALRIGCVVVALFVSMMMCGAVEAQTPTKEATAKAPPGEHYDFEMMKRKPWAEVIQFVSEKTKLPLQGSTLPPPGTFNFIAPAGKKFTIAEVIDIVNEGLLQNKVLLIRGESALVLAASDQKIDPKLIPTILFSELENRGNTEIVSTLYRLHSLVAEDFAPTVKKMMGPFGDVSVVTPNLLKMTDNAGTLKRILAKIKEIEGPTGSEGYTRKLIYIRASFAEAELKKLLDPSPDPGTGEDRKANLFITTDPRTNTIYLRGPQNKIAQAKEYLETNDLATSKASQASIEDLISLALKNNPDMRAAEAEAARMRRLVSQKVSIALSELQMARLNFDDAKRVYDIKQLSIAITPSETGDVFRTFNLYILNAPQSVNSLNAFYAKYPNKPAPYFESDAPRNAISVKGNAVQINEVRKKLIDFGEKTDESNTFKATMQYARAQIELRRAESALDYLVGREATPVLPPNWRDQVIIHKVPDYAAPEGKAQLYDVEPRYRETLELHLGVPELTKPATPDNEKLRGILDQKVVPSKVNDSKVSTKAMLIKLHSKLMANSGLNLIFHTDVPNGRGLDDTNPLNTDGQDDAIPLGAYLHFVEDELKIRFVLRDYGIVVVADTAVPPWADLVLDVWKSRTPAKESPK